MTWRDLEDGSSNSPACLPPAQQHALLYLSIFVVPACMWFSVTFIITRIYLWRLRAISASCYLAVTLPLLQHMRILPLVRSFIYRSICSSLVVALVGVVTRSLACSRLWFRFLPAWRIAADKLSAYSRVAAVGVTYVLSGSIARARWRQCGALSWQHLLLPTTQR